MLYTMVPLKNMTVRDYLDVTMCKREITVYDFLPEGPPMRLYNFNTYDYHLKKFHLPKEVLDSVIKYRSVDGKEVQIYI